MEFDANIKSLLIRARIRQEYWKLSFEDIVFDDESVKSDIQVYYENLKNAYDKGLGMFLTGDYGQGKTMIASVILKRALKQMRTAYFVSMFGFLDFYGGFDMESRTFRKFVRNVDFLCIDDIGSEAIKAKDYSFALLDNLLVERSLPTILTSNKDSKQLASIYGDHLLEFIGTGKMREIFIDSGTHLRNKKDWNEELQNTDDREICW